MAVLAKEEECSDSFLSALVDLRIDLDLPQGTAARAARDGSAGLVAEARRKFANYAAEPARRDTCEKTATNISPLYEEMAEKCLGAQPCDAFATCVMPTYKTMMQNQPVHPPSSDK
ncbi:MAG: hypothetical protein JXR96_01130 [Deltaproteobacteria bacterium]|nr:hypothetical protein [Deltaproteobacteria bacterium]